MLPTHRLAGVPKAAARLLAVVMFVGLFSAGAQPRPAAAQETAPPADSSEIPAIVVDYRRALLDSDAYLSVDAQLDAQMLSFQDEFDIIERELLDTQAELIERRDTLPPEEFNELRRQLLQRAAEAQSDLQRLRIRFDEAQSRAYERIEEELRGVVRAIAFERGARLVFRKDSLYLHDPELEVTALAMERLNARLPFVEVTVDTPWPNE